MCIRDSLLRHPLPPRPHLAVASHLRRGNQYPGFPDGLDAPRLQPRLSPPRGARTMKLILILAPFVIGLLAAIATVAIGGMFISRTHKASRSITLTAAPEQVWSVITDYPSH